jgi:hypothetical protein
MFTDYKEELQRTLSRGGKGIFIPNTMGTVIQENCSPNNPYNNTLPRPLPRQGISPGNGSFHPVPTNQPHNQLQYQTLHHPKSNYVKDYPPSHYQNSPLPVNDYNTIYIRDKLLHDSDIPESCV